MGHVHLSQLSIKGCIQQLTKYSLQILPWGSKIYLWYLWSEGIKEAEFSKTQTNFPWRCQIQYKPCNFQSTTKANLVKHLKVSAWTSQLFLQTLQLWCNYKGKFGRTPKVIAWSEDVKIPCTYWTYEATTNGSFAKVHAGVIYPCKHCSYKVNQNGELKGHQKSVHERVEYIFKHCSYKATMIRNKCMKESNFLVHIAHMKQLKMDQFQNTRRKLMKV